MSTPAVDISVDTSLQCTRSHTVRWSGGSWSAPMVDVRVYTANRTRNRPASVSGTRLNGFVAPLPYHHYGWTWVPAKGSAFHHYREVAGWNPDPAQFKDSFNADRVTYASPAMNRSRVLYTGVANAARLSNARNMSQIRALNKLRDQSVHFGVFLAEFSKSAGMVERNLGQLIALGIKAKKQVGKEALSYWKALTYSEVGIKRTATGWTRNQSTHKAYLKGLDRQRRKLHDRILEFQFGWSPLCNDVVGIVEALNRLGLTLKPRVSVKGYAQDLYHDTLSFNASLGNWMSWEVGYKILQKRFIRAMTRLDAELTDIEAASAEQLGLNGGAEIAWEITPWSFLIDYFVPIGKWIGSLQAPSGWKLVGGSTSHLAETEEVFLSRVVNAPVGAGYQSLAYNCDAIPALCKGFDMSRTTFTSFPKPPPAIDVSPLNGNRVVNMLALLSKTFS